jgi:hypothetical protein
MKTFTVTQKNEPLMKLKAYDIETAWDNFSQIKHLDVDSLKNCSYDIEEQQ